MKKIFVSSTFKDFNAERDAIRNIVTPKLNSIAREYAEAISFCDLRWGVDTTDLETDDGARKVLSVCLDEIDNSKPYIVVLIGDRYGWLPNQKFISDAAEQKNFNVNSNENISVTELEIQYGALKNLDNAIFYFRNIVGEIPTQYHDDYLNDENPDKLQSLRDSIHNLGSNAIIRNYDLSWDSETKSLSVGLDKFCDMLEQDIKLLMDKEWQKRKSWDAYQLDQHLQWDFAQQKSRQYVDHNNLLYRCIKELNHPVMILKQNTTEKSQKGLLTIKGKSGVGKTTLLSRLAFTMKNQGFEVLTIFCGLTANVCTAGDVLRYIVKFIETKLNLAHFNAINNSTIKTSSDYAHQLSILINAWKQKTKNKLILIIEAIDQLIKDRELENLIFVPSKDLSDQVKMIFSYSDELKISRYFNTIIVEELKHKNKNFVIDSITKSLGKDLSQSVINEISKMNSSGNPLYLSLLIQRLEMMRQTDFEKINKLAIELKKSGNENPGMNAINQIQIDIIHSCSNDLEKFCMELVDFAAKNFGEFVKLAVEYIAVSRYGLREEDLAEILKSQGVQWNALNFSIFTNYLSNFFIQRADGRIDFAHKIIRQGIENNIVNMQEYHRHILAYLKTLDFNEPICEQEFIFHCIKADDKKSFVKYIYKLHNYNHCEAMVDVHIQNGIVEDVAIDKYNIFRTFRNLTLADNGNWFSILVQEIKNSKLSFSEKELSALLIFSNNSRSGMIGGNYTARHLGADENIILANLELARIIVAYNNSNENRLQLAIQIHTYSSYCSELIHSVEEFEQLFMMSEEAIDIIKSVLESDKDQINIENFTSVLNNISQIYLIGASKHDVLKHKAETMLNQFIEYDIKILYSYPKSKNIAALAEIMFKLGEFKCSTLFPENIPTDLSDVTEGITLCEQSISMLEKIVKYDNYLKVENKTSADKDDQKLRFVSLSRQLIIPDLVGYYNFLTYIYKSYTSFQNLNKALEYNQKALKWSGVVRDVTPSYHADWLFASALEDGTDIHMKMARPDYLLTATSYIQEAIKVRTFWFNHDSQNDMVLVKALMQDFKYMGFIYAQYENYSAAQLYFKGALNLAKTLDDKKEMVYLCDCIIAVCNEHRLGLLTQRGNNFVIADNNGQPIELNELELQKLIEEKRRKTTSKTTSKKIKKTVQKYSDLKEHTLEEIHSQRLLITRNDNHHIAHQYYNKISSGQLAAIDEYLAGKNSIKPKF